VNYLHSIGIMHRDLKLENFLFKNQMPDSELKLIDFGLSIIFGQGEPTKFESKVGTPLYVAPEVIRGMYDEKCDYWSLGVMMYILLCGYPPFDGDNTNEIFKLIVKGEYSMSGLGWSRISRPAKDLIAGLLETKPN